MLILVQMCRVIHISFQIWFWCCILVEPLWLRGRSGVRILSRGSPLSNYSLNVIQTCVNLNNGTLPPKQDVQIGLNIHKKQSNAVSTKSLCNRGILVKLVICVVPGHWKIKILNLKKKISFFAFLCFYIPSKEEKIMGHLIWQISLGFWQIWCPGTTK